MVATDLLLENHLVWHKNTNSWTSSQATEWDWDEGEAREGSLGTSLLNIIQSDLNAHFSLRETDMQN